MKSFILSMIALLFHIAVIAQQYDCYLRDEEAGNRPRQVDFQHLKLEAQLFPNEGKIVGSVEHTFLLLQNKVDSIFLDAPKIKINKVTLNGKEAKFESNDKGVTIWLGNNASLKQTHQLLISYEANPKKGLYFIGWNESEPTNKVLTNVRKQVWTQGQGIDNRHWIPCFDDMNDKVTSEIKIAFDKKYKVLSNGALISNKEQKDGSVLWHYKMQKPHAPYLIMLAIGNYEIKSTTTKRGVGVNNWYYPEFPNTVEPTFRYTENMIDWMEQEYGINYPWEQYSQVPTQDFMFGAMENTTATVFGDFYITDARAFLDRNYIGTNAHELVHQWFGDYITAWGAEDTWLQESFATHYQKHFERSVFGEDHFHWNRLNELNQVLAAAKDNNNPIRHTKAGSARIYPKGSLVLDMLRYVIGDEHYRKAVTHYLKNHAYDNVDMHDFKDAFRESLGFNLDWFFDQWVLRGGEPHYKVHYEDLTYNDGSKATEIAIEQIHKTDESVKYFKMPIELEVHYTDGTKSYVKETIEQAFEIVKVPNSDKKKIAFVLFDPNGWIVKTLTFKKELEELKAQAEKAISMTARYEAIKAMSDLSLSTKKEFLLKQFNKEKFYGIRAEMAKQLVQKIDSLNENEMALLIQDKHSKVRLSAIDNAKEIPTRFASLYEKLLSDSSYYVVEKTLVKLTECSPEKLSVYLEKTKNDWGIGSHVKIKWHEMASRQNLTLHGNELAKLASPQYEFRTRAAAFEALKRINFVNDEVVKNAFHAMTHFNSRLSNPTKAVVKYFMEQYNYKKLFTQYYKSQTWETWQKDKLKDVFEE